MDEAEISDRQATRILRSEEETAALAARLSASLAPGDCLLLSGAIGAGKSVFARAAIQAMMAAEGVVEDVPSPTFTLVQTYAIGDREVWHADLYRLSDLQEIEELGLAEAFAHATSFVEWPDRLGGLAPPGALRLNFAPGPAETDRILTLSWNSPRWTRQIGGLADA